jgi:hypothetical protein
MSDGIGKPVKEICFRRFMDSPPNLMQPFERGIPLVVDRNEVWPDYRPQKRKWDCTAVV